MQIPCDVVQEYEVPPGVTAVRIEAGEQRCGPAQQKRRDVADSTWRYPSAALGVFTIARIARGPSPRGPKIRDPIGTSRPKN
jgi:hypothetical protein